MLHWPCLDILIQKHKTVEVLIMKKRINFYSVQLVREKSKMYEMNTEGRSVSSPGSAAKIVNDLLDMQNLTKEHFVILCLDTKRHISGVHTVHIGSLDASIVHPREVFQLALLNNASAIIAFHNHPSGNPSASSADIEVTHRLVEAGKLLGIPLLDHIIIGDGKYRSLKDDGIIK